MTFLAVKERALELTLCLLIGSALAACSSESSKTTTLSNPTATHSSIPTIIVKTSITPSPSATSIPGSTHLPTPRGAGLVTPVLTFQLDTTLENLEPGEYLVVLDNEASMREGTAIFQFVSWDAQEIGNFFHLVPHNENEKRVVLTAETNGRLWFEVENPPSLLVLELPTLQTRQFLFGSMCERYVRAHHIGSEYFTFECGNDASKHYLYFVSIEDWHIISVMHYTEGLFITGWLSDTLELSSLQRINVTDFQYCLIEPPFLITQCKDVPFRVGTTSPAGDWTWIAPEGNTESFSIANPLAIIPRDCIDTENEKCQPIIVTPPSEWQEQYQARFSYLAWSPDSRHLYVTDLECWGNPPNRSWIWYIELETGESCKLVQLNDCYEFPFTGSIWSSDGQRFVVNASAVLDQPLVISLAGTPVSYPLPVKGWVVGTFQIP